MRPVCCTSSRDLERKLEENLQGRDICILSRSISWTANGNAGNFA
ncbi:hypothetical protein M3J09_006554 [Ascochyta lentis]